MGDAECIYKPQCLLHAPAYKLHSPAVDVHELVLGVRTHQRIEVYFAYDTSKNSKILIEE